MTLHESITILERLTARADEWQRRYAIELLAHEDVRDGQGPIRVARDSEQPWYDTAYAEAELKRDLQ